MKFTVVVQRTILDTIEVEAKDALEAESIVMSGEFLAEQITNSEEDLSEIVSIYSPTWAINKSV